VISAGHISGARFRLLTAAISLAALLAACDSRPARPPDPDPILEPVFTPTAVVCPSEPEPITLHVAGPESSATIVGRLLIDDRSTRSFNCQIGTDGRCRLVTQPLGTAATYSFSVELPDTSQMRIVDGRAAYDYEPFQLTLAQGSRQQDFTERAVDTVTMTFPVRFDESNCLAADFRDVVVSTQAAAEPKTEVHLASEVLMTDLGNEVCQQVPVDTPLSAEVLLAAGTDLTDVQVIYEIGNQSKVAQCQVYEDAFVCTAIVPNPIIGQFFAVRAIVKDEVYTGFQLPFSNLCIYFSN
jgi:hypothetical protein